MAKKTIDEAVSAEVTIPELDAFGNSLQEIEKAVNSQMNIFRAMGLINQEAHHSAFFAGLLKPDNPHRLGDFFLRIFLESLYDYQTKPDDVTKNFSSNAEILARQKISSKQELLSLIQGYVSVEKEVKTFTKTDNESGRMDILIEIPTSKTVIVIENKTGTTTHDNQLQKYQNEIDFRDKDYKKIFIYLSPGGELPYDRPKKKSTQGARYNADWCVFDYKNVCQLLQKTIEELESKNSLFQMNAQDKKILLYGLKEYLDMCNTELLNENVGKFEKCAEIIGAHPAAIKKISEYFNSPLPENVIRYCAQKINGDPNIDGPKVFATQAMRDFFEKNGETFSIAMLRCYVNPKGNKPFNGFEIYVEFENVNNDPPYNHQWTPAQKKLIDELLRLDKLKKSPNASTRLVSAVSLLDAADCYQSMDEVAPKLEANLAKFMVQLNELDDILKSLTPTSAVKS